MATQVWIELPVEGGSGSAGVTSLNGETGDVNIVAGSGITVTPSGQNITITNTGAGQTGSPNTISGFDGSGNLSSVVGSITDSNGQVQLNLGGTLPSDFANPLGIFSVISTDLSGGYTGFEFSPTISSSMVEFIGFNSDAHIQSGSIIGSIGIFTDASGVDSGALNEDSEYVSFTAAPTLNGSPGTYIGINIVPALGTATPDSVLGSVVSLNGLLTGTKTISAAFPYIDETTLDGATTLGTYSSFFATNTIAGSITGSLSAFQIGSSINASLPAGYNGFYSAASFSTGTISNINAYSDLNIVSGTATVDSYTSFNIGPTLNATFTGPYTGVLIKPASSASNPTIVAGLDVDVSALAGGTNYSIRTAAGQVSFGDVLDMTTHLIHNVVDPVDPQDAATKAYVDAHSGGSGSPNSVPYFDGGGALANDPTIEYGLNISQAVSAVTTGYFAKSDVINTDTIILGFSSLDTSVDSITTAVGLSTGSNTTVSGTAATGNMILSTGYVTDAGSTAGTGPIQIFTGQTVGNGQTGGFNITSGSSTSGATGSIHALTGTAGTNSGIIDFGTGDSGNSSGSITFSTGEATSSFSGDITFVTGNSTSSTTGNVNIASGDTNSSSDSGNINIATGITTGSTAGAISLETGNASGIGLIQLKNGSEGTAGQVWTSSDGSGSGQWMDSPYTPSTPANWAGTPPSTVAEALDRMANVVSVGGTSPIP